MFRSPLDVSSDSEGDIVKTESNEEIASIEVIERQTTKTESLPFNISVNQDNEASQSNTTEHHASFLLAGLLEDYSRVRAAEIMNTSTGSSFTRHSPEVRPLASQLYAQHGRMLDTHSVLPAVFTRPEAQAQKNRSQYLNFLDSATLKGLQGSEMPDAQHLSNLLTADMTNLALTPTMTLPATSPYQDLTFSTRSTPHLGRYQSEFEQVRLLGQGGYGRVFHVVNAVDQTHYAIKRIPLSPKVYARWVQGDHQSARTFQEIRTLARLEHPNVVRYYGAWVELSPTLQQPNGQLNSRGRPGTRRLLADRPALAESPNRAVTSIVNLEPSDGIVFGEDTEPHQTDLRNVEQSVHRLIAQMPSKDQQTTSAYSMRDSEIFTDGRSQSMKPVDTTNENSAVLCVQMGLHPMTLSTYLSALPANSKQPLAAPSVRHCFHLLPSLRLLLSIVCGLQYLHSLGIVHRDIKPGNILLSESVGQHAVGFYDVGSCYNCPERMPYYLNPRIADFGLVAEIERSTQIDPSTPYKGAGTELYRPPPSSSESINEKLDVFALGVLFVEMLWRFGTKTERAMVLGGLQRGEVPAGLCARVDVDCGHGIGQKVVQCVQGMVRHPAERWTLDMTKAWAEGLLEELERSIPSFPANGDG